MVLVSIFDSLLDENIFEKNVYLDEGHFQKILDNEVRALKNACIEVYGNRPLPKITFVIIKKSHNTRFFAPNGQQITNMAAGTVIDTTVVHPRQFDFYLNSHAGALGTNVCSYYHVLYNEIEFTSDELQQLTFWVTILFMIRNDHEYIIFSFVILTYDAQKL